jgi:hypothetical protein
MSVTSDEESQVEVEAWKQVHEHLTNAVIVAKEAVAAKKAQRRFWMEEICANLTPEGKLTVNSVWNRPSIIKKTVIKRIQKPKAVEVAVKKPRKRKASTEPNTDKPKKVRKKKIPTDSNTPPKPKKIRLKTNKKGKMKQLTPEASVLAEDHSQEASETVDEEDSDTETGLMASEYPPSRDMSAGAGAGASSLMRAADYAHASAPQWGHAVMVSQWCTIVSKRSNALLLPLLLPLRVPTNEFAFLFSDFLMIAGRLWRESSLSIFSV